MTALEVESGLSPSAYTATTFPPNWRVRRLKTPFREVDERNGSPDGLLLSLTRSRGLIPQHEASTRIASVDDLSNYKKCRSGDLVMNRMQTWSGQFASAFQEGLVSPDYSVFVPSPEANVEFFQYLLRTPMMFDQFAQASRGIGTGFNRLYGDDFGTINVLCPPLDEQAAIVKYLAHLDRKIDRLIRSKRRMNQQNQAILQAVTSGLDPSVPMKDSRVE